MKVKCVDAYPHSTHLTRDKVYDVKELQEENEKLKNELYLLKNPLPPSPPTINIATAPNGWYKIVSGGSGKLNGFIVHVMNKTVVAVPNELFYEVLFKDTHGKGYYKNPSIQGDWVAMEGIEL